MMIVVSGSMKFYQQMEYLAVQLRLKGHEVEVPSLLAEQAMFGDEQPLSFDEALKQRGGVDAVPPADPLWEKKKDMMDEHFSKLEKADAVLLVNYQKNGIDGYIGGNALMEMALAYYLKKKLFVMFDVSSKLSYKEEILGMRPVFLEGDLSRLI